jgi:hypothetical protein
MFGIYVSTTYDKFMTKNLMEEYLYSKYPYLPQNVIHSIEIAFPSYKKQSYIVILNIEPTMIPDFNQQLFLGITICPDLVCQHINVY